MIIRRRKTTSSSTKSKHSENFDDDGLNQRHPTLTQADGDLSTSFDINNLENEAFLPEDDNSGSFGVEFVDSSKSENIQSLDLDNLDFSESDGGIVFSNNHKVIVSRVIFLILNLS